MRPPKTLPASPHPQAVRISAGAASWLSLLMVVLGHPQALTAPIPPGPASAPETVSSPSGEAAAAMPSAPVSTPLTGLVTIESDLQKVDNNTGVITATGNVRIVYSDRGVVATARQAQYFSREARVVLSGDVEVVQEGGNRLLADRVVVLIERERLVAHPEPGQQVTSRVRIPVSGASPAAVQGPAAEQAPALEQP